MIYSKINQFCSVRNNGSCFKNGVDPTPRVKFLIDLLDKEGIPYELDVFSNRPSPMYRRYDETLRFRRTQNPRLDFDDFEDIEDDKDIKDEIGDIPKDRSRRRFNLFGDLRENNYFNIILRGTSDKMVVAHHDVSNHSIDNANDNSASVINAIALKKLRPNIHVVLLDGEEFGGIGSEHLSKQINDGKFGRIKWVLNLELTGKGGKYFFIGNYPGPLMDHILSIFKCPVVHTPYNDSVTIRRHGIDSLVINALPPISEETVREREEKSRKEKEKRKKQQEEYNKYLTSPEAIERRRKNIESSWGYKRTEEEKERYIQTGYFYEPYDHDYDYSYGGRSDVIFEGVPLDSSYLSHCHTIKDNLESISPEDMKEFVEEVLVKIVD